jgi:RNA polymerase sigma-70 factor, ECF subfamily
MQSLSLTQADVVRLSVDHALALRTLHRNGEAGRSLRMVSMAQAGDRQAAEWLYRQFQGRVFALMRRIVGHQDAEDLTQQCFLTMLRRIGDFAGKSSFWTWFYRLSVNEALQHLRRKSRRPVPSSMVEELCDHREQGGGEPIETREAVVHALHRLSPAQRDALKLHYQQGLSYKDISQRLAIPMGTVGSRINQAKTYMAKTLDIDRSPVATRSAA